MNPNDSGELPQTRKNALKYEPLGVFRSAVVLAFVIAGIWYLNWRIPTLAPDAPVFSGIIYGAEVYGFLSALLHLMMTWRLSIRQPPSCPPGLSVDVFVLTYNEPVDLIRKTLLAAKHMDYPHETWLLDDGNRQEMMSLAGHLGVRYLSRLENTNAKAGNLNNAMAHSRGEFVAIFDADHAPQRNFLTQTLGYFNDASIAFVQTPQDFFNLDSYQHRWEEKKRELWTEQSLFFKVIQRGKDYWNAAYFCGSCAVVRRAALDKIGGFATQTVTEDLHTSIKLHKAGFSSVYHAEPLAFGIAPANVAPFLHQRVRWGQGAMQVLKKEKLLLFDRGLTIPQKLNYLASILTYFDGWQKGIYYISPAIVLFTGVLPIQAGAVDFLLHFVPFYVLSYLMFEEVGRGYGGTGYIAQYNFARFAAFAWATLGLFLGKLRFRVTAKTRDRATNTGQLFLPQMAILLLNTAAIPFGLVLARQTHLQSLNWIYFNVFWATVNCGIALVMLNFTQHIQKFLREEYRFPIPLPVVLREGDDTIHGIIDNISISGCSIYAALPATARTSHVLRGEIYLPSGPLAFEAQIMNEITGQERDHAYMKAVGCRFMWGSVENREALELFLYGTDLQRKLLGISESHLTPRQWLGHWLLRVGQPLKAPPGEHWATCSISFNDRAALPPPLHFGLIPLTSDGTWPRHLVTFSPLPFRAKVDLKIFTRTRQIEMQARVSLGEYLENSAGPVFLYPLSACEITGMRSAVHPEYLTDVVLKKKPALRPALGAALRFALLSAVLCGLFIYSATSSAAGQPAQLFAGYEGSTDTSYTYVGRVAPLSDSQPNRGLVSRVWFDWSKYRYAKDGQTLDVSAPGAELAVGYREADANRWWAVYAGLAYRNSSISPDDPANNLRGGMVRPIVHLEGEQALGEMWRLVAGASYILGQQAYWARGRVLRDAWDGVQIGPEATTQGDPNYYANQFGAVLLGLKIGKNMDLGLKVGRRQVERLNSQNYFGIELGGIY